MPRRPSKPQGRRYPPDPLIDRLVERRVQLGLTQRQVADALFLSQTALSAWERRVNDVNLTELRRWADHLGVNIKHFNAPASTSI